MSYDNSVFNVLKRVNNLRDYVDPLSFSFNTLPSSVFAETISVLQVVVLVVHIQCLTLFWINQVIDFLLSGYPLFVLEIVFPLILKTFFPFAVVVFLLL